MADVKYYTLKEVSDLFRVRVETLYYWIDQGKHFKRSALMKIPGGRYLIPDHEVDRLLKEFSL